MQKTAILVFVFLFWFAAHAQQDSIATDRPGFSSTPYTVPASSYQIEVGTGAEMLGSTGSSKRVLPEVLFKAGLGSKTELRLGMQFYKQTYFMSNGYLPTNFGHSYSAPSIGLKQSLIKNEKQLLSLQAEAQLEVLRASYSNNRPIEGHFRLIYQYQSRGKYAFLHNSIYNSLQNQFSMTFNNQFQTSSKSLLYVELFLEKLHKIGKPAFNPMIDGGLVHQLKPNLQLDFSAGMRMKASSTAASGHRIYWYFVNAGLSALLH